jgi:L-ascorbate oxidase
MGNSTDILGSVPRPQLDGYLDYGGSVYGNDTHYPSGLVQFFNITEWVGLQ